MVSRVRSWYERKRFARMMRKVTGWSIERTTADEIQLAWNARFKERDDR